MGAFRAAVFFVLIVSAGQSGPDPGALLKEADRLAWLRAWSAAESHFLQAQKLFAARGNERDALYAKQAALYSNFADYETATTRKIPVIAITPG